MEEYLLKRECKYCRKTFYGNGHRTVCDECKRTRHIEAVKRNNAKKSKYICKYCKTRANASVCHICKEKLRLWGIIIQMVKNEKEKCYGRPETKA
jgi:hypothetical protein